jgi:hypothetical protein
MSEYLTKLKEQAHSIAAERIATERGDDWTDEGMKDCALADAGVALEAVGFDILVDTLNSFVESQATVTRNAGLLKRHIDKMGLDWGTTLRIGNLGDGNLVIMGADNEPAITIDLLTHDVVLGDNYEPEGAAALFWQAVRTITR